MAGGENTIAWSTNREHFVCLELLILLVMESCKHTISICMVLRSDGGDKRGKKPSSRLCWSRMMCSRQPCVSEACEEIKSQAEESSDRGAVSTRQQSRAVRKALNCGRSAPIFFSLGEACIGMCVCVRVSARELRLVRRRLPI
jgi:hypothetical protein